MTLPQVLELTAYWAKHPPVHLLVAAYLGYRRKDSAPSPNDIGALLAKAPGGVCRIDRLRE